MDYFIVAENVTRTYEDKIALDNFNIKIPKGSIYGILGPNGAGKTTFIRIINQITKPDSGTIYFNGEPLQPKHISHIGYMPEERGLYKNMKIGEQAIYLAQLKGMNKTEAKSRLEYWFDKLKIEKWWNKKLSELSKGMAQKIQFVVTVLHNPELLIFDEPFSGFDPVNANLIRDEILELKEKGTTILFSSHRMESVEELCDYVALIHNSKKILDGSVKDIRHKFKQGKFNIRITDIQSHDIEHLLSNHPIENLIKMDNEYSFSIKLTDRESSKSLLSELSSKGTILSFYEEIPSMNEVFINAVNSKNL
ncbi:MULTISPECIES: ABC transporter ATP-binding protein [unclassified Apibacter]|uniref:ABC transporter ATP-binding protein n=1 Tax=unclassified Apibacter TaxID=2630820 RepID=UPI001321B7C8|nr:MULTISPECIES: ATP-binding cassette domain-containing protein [unclassified Apibacter]MCX8676666.1 ATP-binding cassette domain-containing protein [Apibacter sp. B3919]MXO24124.1 ATP-binding cassette domain-containing protein [Apibacter sp. B3924]MXO26195.1 ATP-binding cassette domain-containing protein [Apibacter sp. B3813]MXO28146.1 ATP-binding cassette domain-containing protein [Apibacter sp. B3913]MXO30100.1 ATP-binding cassette domain-containing protein [Apibacter sp. B3912]